MVADEMGIAGLITDNEGVESAKCLQIDPPTPTGGVVQRRFGVVFSYPIEYFI